MTREEAQRDFKDILERYGYISYRPDVFFKDLFTECGYHRVEDIPIQSVVPFISNLASRYRSLSSEWFNVVDNINNLMSSETTAIQDIYRFGEYLQMIYMLCYNMILDFKSKNGTSRLIDEIILTLEFSKALEDRCSEVEEKLGFLISVGEYLTIDSVDEMDINDPISNAIPPFIFNRLNEKFKSGWLYKNYMSVSDGVSMRSHVSKFGLYVTVSVSYDYDDTEIIYRLSPFHRVLAETLAEEGRIINE